MNIAMIDMKPREWAVSFVAADAEWQTTDGYNDIIEIMYIKMNDVRRN